MSSSSSIPFYLAGKSVPHLKDNGSFQHSKSLTSAGIVICYGCLYLDRRSAQLCSSSLQFGHIAPHCTILYPSTFSPFKYTNISLTPPIRLHLPSNWQFLACHSWSNLVHSSALHPSNSFTPSSHTSLVRQHSTRQIQSKSRVANKPAPICNYSSDSLTDESLISVSEASNLRSLRIHLHFLYWLPIFWPFVTPLDGALRASREV